MILWGYRSDEVHVPKIWPLKNGITAHQIHLDPSSKITVKTENDRNIRRPVAGSLGCHVEGAACPHPDLNDTSTSIEGGLYRVCPTIPGYGKDRKKFVRFVRRWIKSHLVPLRPDSNTSVEAWLAKTNYSIKRKAELLRKNLAITNKFDKKYAFLKSFIKDEFYPDYKHARTINSRTDEFKTMVGPIFQLIGDEVFSLPYFIKKIPIDERPRVIMEAMGTIPGRVYATDFSSFEAHFGAELMRDCEFELYKYMTQHLVEHKDFMRWCRNFTSINRLEFKTFVLHVLAKRMSGEMCTSLGNGFSNLMIILYTIYKKNGNRDSNVQIFVEGDDSIFKTHVQITTQDFTDFGCRVKLEEFTDECRASFCGMVFDTHDQTNVTDPREVLSTFGWTTAKYIRSKKSIHLSLLRCKALSLAYQYPACPILSKLAFNMLRLTRSHEVERFSQKHMQNQYEHEILLHAIRKNKNGQLLFSEPGFRTRKMVEELYSISIDQQLLMEKFFDEMSVVCPLPSEIFLNHMQPQWIDYYARYGALVNPRSSLYEHPGPLWTPVKDRVLSIPST